MANLWYLHTTYPATNSQGSSSAMRAELDAIMAGFAMLPDPLGAGRQGFSGGRWENATVIGGTLDDVDIGVDSPGLGNFTTLVAGSLTGTFTKTGAISIDGSAGTNRVLSFLTDAKARFNVYAGNEAETGANAGTALHMDAVNDDGTTVNPVMSVARATQIVTLAKRPLFGTATPWDSGNLASPMTLDTTQTVTAAKTFSGGLSTTGGTTSLSVVAGSAVVEIGGPASTGSFLDWHSVGGSGNDYDLRISVTGGTAGTSGKGNASYQAANHFFSGDIYLQSAGSFSQRLMLQAGSFSPFIRAGNDGSIQFINSANTFNNLTVFDNGNATLRGILSSGGAIMNGTLDMQNYNQIKLGGPAYAGFLRGDSGGLVGFINQAGNNWTLQIWNDGHIVAGGNIQAFSDETLKKNWEPLAADIVDQIATIQKSGTFERNDIAGRHVGIGAQSLRRFMPAAVSDVNGTLAVNYGGAALALCVELCREVKDMRSRLAHLEDAT
jgi:hypothetical protein